MILDLTLPRLALRRGMVHVFCGETITSDPRWNTYPNAYSAVEFELESGYISRETSGEATTRVLASDRGAQLGFRPIGGLPAVGDHVFKRKAVGRFYLGHVTKVDVERGEFWASVARRPTGPGTRYLRAEIRGLRVAAEGE